MDGVVANGAKGLSDPLGEALVDEQLHAVGRSRGSSRSRIASAA
jgi:hypothetical protein